MKINKNENKCELISLDEAISRCQEVENRDDVCCDYALVHAQLAAWLEELKFRRSKDPVLMLLSVDNINESNMKCPTMREAIRIFKKNGYTLVSQRGSHQKWVKPDDPIPIILPYHSRDNEQVRTSDWKRVVKEHNLKIDV
jgi:predicted RNA binding protein YcfA (HicA-like mRNA interferase family)